MAATPARFDFSEVALFVEMDYFYFMSVFCADVLY